MHTTQLHDNQFLTILWDEQTSIIGIEWKEGASAMSDDDFKGTLTLFAGYVEQHKAEGSW